MAKKPKGQNVLAEAVGALREAEERYDKDKTKANAESKKTARLRVEALRLGRETE